MRKPVILALMILPLGFLFAAEPAATRPEGAQMQPSAASNSESKPMINFGAVPKSVFVIPSTTGEGRNPFFPRPIAMAAPVIERRSDPQPDTSFLVLNGITGPPLRTAMINGRTFVQGEEGEIRTQTGDKVLIRCAQIGDENAIIEIGGVRKELRLRLGI